MTTTRGRCSNVDYCTLAAGRRDIAVPVGEDFSCPECTRPLRAPPAPPPQGGLRLGLMAGGAALLLIGGGIYAGTRLTGGGGSAVAAVLQHPAPAAPPRLAALAPPSVRPAPAPASPPAPALAPAPPAARPEQVVLLRLAGAPAAGAAASRLLAAAYLTALGDSAVRLQPGSAGGLLVSGQRLARPEAVAIVAGVGDDAAAFAALGSHAADAVIVTRRATPAEAAAWGGGDAAGRQLGSLAEAVVVNPRNPVGQISLAQLHGVLSGAITEWSALGGPARAIHLLRRTDDARLEALLPGASRAGHPLANPAAAVMDDADALAIVPAGEAGQARPLAIAAIGAPPALPTPAAIAGEAYPLARPVYVYARAGETAAFAQRLASFAVSPDGQAAVAQSGLVPLHVALVPEPGPLTTKERYRALVLGAKRLAADLHFEPNSNKLDLHSTREVDRIWNFMMSDHTPSDHIVLIGFADNQGTPDANLAISRQRAQAVADVFARRGLPPGRVVPFGAELPVADNGSEDGRERNRRVEVFLRP